jgi:TRAP-type C4-dicarboxylate transport system permease small subunit
MEARDLWTVGAAGTRDLQTFMRRGIEMVDRNPSKVVLLFDRILAAGAVFAGLMVFFMMLSVCYDVVSRYFFNAPTVWADEISSVFLLFTPFFVGAWLLKRDGHVKMDLVVSFASPRTQLILEIAVSLIIAQISAIFIYYGSKIAWQVFEMGYRTDSILRLHKWPLISVIPLGFFLMFLQAIRNTVDRIRRLTPR